MSRKTSHQIARELLALPDLPIFHYDASFVDRATDEDNPSLGEVSVSVDDACEGMSAEDIEALREEGGFIGKFIVIEGDQLPEMDRPELDWAAHMVFGERQRQKEEEGYGDAHDDRHTKGELSAAAASYAMAASAQIKFRREFMDDIAPPSQWPWARADWKLKPDAWRTLVKAAALLLAEIARLRRLETVKKGDA